MRICLFVTIDCAAPRLCLASPRIVHRSAPLHLLPPRPCRRGCTTARTRSVFLPCTDNHRLWLEFVYFVSKNCVGILKAVIYATRQLYFNQQTGTWGNKGNDVPSLPRNSWGADSLRGSGRTQVAEVPVSRFASDTPGDDPGLCSGSPPSTVWFWWLAARPWSKSVQA